MVRRGESARPLGRRRLLEGIAAVGGAALFPACVSQPEAVAPLWANAVGVEAVLPRATYRPAAARDLVATVRAAESLHLRVRMIGAGHSHSDVAVVEDWQLLPDGLQGFLELDRGRLRPEYRNAATLVRIQSGVHVRDLNAELDRRGLALENMGGWDGQTYVGAAMTATHGSGLAFGPLASQIASLQVVTCGGNVLQLEPSNGISDPSTFPGHLEEDPSVPVTLEQQDDLFNAAVVSMGCLGIVYSVVLCAVPKYWIHETRTVTTWGSLISSGGALSKLVARTPGGPDHVEVYFTPYANPASQPEQAVCLLTERWRLSSPPDHPPEPIQRGSLWSQLVTAVGVELDRAHLLLPLVANYGREDWRGAHEGALRGMAHDGYTDLSYRVFNLGLPNLLRAYSVELALGLDQTIRAADRLYALAGELAAKGIYYAAPISLRFVAPARAHLAMQEGRPTCMVEVGMLVGLHGAEELLRRTEEAFIGELNARPHWGLDRDILRGSRWLAALYPSWPKWKKAFDELNATGVFDAHFTDRLGISATSRP